MSTREERRKMWKRAIREAIDAMRGDNAFENLDCTVVGLNRFPEPVRRCLIEAIGEVQDKYLPSIAAAIVAFLEDKREQMERDG